MKLSDETVVAVVGLGYVGLPLAVEFGKKFQTIGYDVAKEKIRSYAGFVDPTGEMSPSELRSATRLRLTCEPDLLSGADFIIIAVPTPVDAAHRPDFSHLVSSSATAGRHMKRNAVVIYESTVYPGATEEICIPLLEKNSGMTWKKDFHVGYSPERINPGDKEHALTRILKVVSADDAETLDKVSALYESIILAGVFRAPSIMVAEAAKVIENTQRDLNIALMNELAVIFEKIGIDTSKVLEAAQTKWNFLKFQPGLVGGHCIGVDPYYLTHKAEMLGYHPQVITAGRRINDGMTKFVAEKTVKLMIQQGTSIKHAKVIMLGVTFKENCSDLRNSKVIELVKELKDFGCELYVHDPLADKGEAAGAYGISLTAWDDLPHDADALIIAVPHKEYLDKPAARLADRLSPRGVICDVKSAFDEHAFELNGRVLWRL